MKKFFLFFLGVFILISCSHQEEANTNNENTSFVNNLISPKSCITYEQEMYVPEEYSSFFKTIDFPNFLLTLQEKTINNKITAYIPFSNLVCDADNIQLKFQDEFSPNEIKDLLFDEEWALDTAQFLMKKKVNSYTLVRNYVRKSELGDIPTKTLVATYDFSQTGYHTCKDKDFKLLAKDVTYEVPLYNEDNPEFLDNMLVKHVINTIMEKILSGNIEYFSFLSRDTQNPYTLEEIRHALGQETICYEEEDPETFEIDTFCVEKNIDFNEICGLAFIEDWYLNETSMEIFKEVKAIAPIRAYYHDDTQPELVKSIPFVMYLKNHDKGK